MRRRVQVRAWFVEAGALVEEAERRFVAVAAAIDQAAPDGLPRVERARRRMELARAARDARRAVDLLCDLHGSSGFARANPLQRFWRDLAVGSRHGALTPYVVIDDYGRQLLTDEAPILPA